MSNSWKIMRDQEASLTLRLINMVIHHITQITSIALGFIWFGWKGGLVIFLVNWAANTKDG